MSRQSILVVGGTRGIGRAVVEGLRDQGHQPRVMARGRPDKGCIEDHRFLAHDVTTDGWPDRSLPEQIHGLVYAPGSITLRPFPQLSPETFREDYELNVMGAVRVLQKTGSMLRNHPDPSNVVLFSTVATRVGLPYHTSIASAKSAVEGLAKSLAAEWAPSVRVNVIAPSLTRTPLSEPLLNSEQKRTRSENRHPLQSIGQPEQIAGLVLHLLLQDHWITGHVLPVDGGMSSLRTG